MCSKEQSVEQKESIDKDNNRLGTVEENKGGRRMIKDGYFRRVALNEMRRTKDVFFRSSLLMSITLMS